MKALALDLKGITSDKGWLQKVAIGSIISYTAVLLCTLQPLFLPLSVAMTGVTYGYLLRVMRQTINAVKAPDAVESGTTGNALPPWDNWLDLMISGISWSAIALGFAFCGAGLFVAFLLFGVESGQANIIDPRFQTFASIFFLATVSVYTLGHGFASLLMVNFAEQENMKAGFMWFKVLRRFWSAPLPFALSLLAGFAMSAAAMALPAMTVVLLCVAPFFIFLGQILSARLLARTWALSDASD